MRRACQTPLDPLLPCHRITDTGQGAELSFQALKLCHNDAPVPEIPWRASHPSAIQAQCCMTSMFKWELVYQHGNSAGIYIYCTFSTKAINF